MTNYTVNCQFFALNLKKIYTGQKKITQAPPVTNMRYVNCIWIFKFRPLPASWILFVPQVVWFPKFLMLLGFLVLPNVFSAPTTVAAVVNFKNRDIHIVKLGWWGGWGGWWDWGRWLTGLMWLLEIYCYVVWRVVQKTDILCSGWPSAFTPTLSNRKTSRQF